MTNCELIKDILLPNLSIGDLVRLNEDSALKIGIGIVEDIKLNFNDICDIGYLLDKIEDYNAGVKFNSELNGFFSSKPQALIMWSGKKLKKTNSMWMYTSEITIVHKVISPGENK